MELDKVEVERLISLLRAQENAYGSRAEEESTEDLVEFLKDIIKDKTGLYA